MPPSDGNRNRSSGQPRVFRGRGRPKDGNIPPKKPARTKVKYKQEENAERVDEEAAAEILDQENDLASCEIEHLSLNEVDGVPQNNKLLDEINHLDTRIQNVQEAMQTSQGLSNPKKWRTNCLFPVKNVVKEWRSILLFHLSSGCEKEQFDDGISNTDTILVKSISPNVFGLIQMSMQTGPLVGSNPGYFKRCGGEVASMAFEFLTEIIELAEVNDKIGIRCEDVSIGEDGDCADATTGLEEDAFIENEDEEHEQKSDGNHCSNSSSGSIESDDQSQSGSSSSEFEENITHSQEITPPEETNTPVPTADGAQLQTINNLQSTLFFTEKQSRRLCQWVRNAEKAKAQNKPPTASAAKLQDQKSKKQTLKDLKKERKTKKKKRGGVS